MTYFTCDGSTYPPFAPLVETGAHEAVSEGRSSWRYDVFTSTASATSCPVYTSTVAALPSLALANATMVYLLLPCSVLLSITVSTLPGTGLFTRATVMPFLVTRMLSMALRAFPSWSFAGAVKFRVAFSCPLSPGVAVTSVTAAGALAFATVFTDTLSTKR